MINRIVAKLVALKCEKLACFVLSCASLILGKFSKFSLVENRFWVQAQGGVFFVDLAPNYRLNAAEEDALYREIFFHSYTPKSGDVCVDVGAGIGTETKIMSGSVGEGKVFRSRPLPGLTGL